MQKLIVVIKRVTFLPPIPTILLALPCFSLVAYVLLMVQEQSWLAYSAYLLSAYAMVITSTWLYRVGKNLKETVTQQRLWKYYKSDAVLRTELALTLGCVLNGLYVAVNILSAVLYQSFWFVALSIYYLILFLLQVDLFRHITYKFVEQCQIDGLKKVRLYGSLLLVMDLALAVIVYFMVHWNYGYEYPGVLIYAMALHAFTALGIAIWNLLKYRKYGNMILTTAKILSLTAALVSILSLETAMLSAFGSGTDATIRQWMTALTGVGVCMIILTMAVFMIMYSNQLIQREKNNKG